MLGPAADVLVRLTDSALVLALTSARALHRVEQPFVEEGVEKDPIFLIATT